MCHEEEASRSGSHRRGHSRCGSRRHPDCFGYGQDAYHAEVGSSEDFVDNDAAPNDANNESHHNHSHLHYAANHSASDYAASNFSASNDSHYDYAATYDGACTSTEPHSAERWRRPRRRQQWRSQ